VTDLPLQPGDRVEMMTVLSGLTPGGSCRPRTKTVERVDKAADKVFFTDGTTYNHRENPEHTLRKIHG
jgi:hypothetical protein